MRELVEILGEFADQFDAISVAYQAVENLHKLILDELPYGQIDPNGLVQGIIEIDGPAQNPPNAKKPLQWSFGGSPYEVCKAIRIQYGYQRYMDGMSVNATGSLFVGYELDDSYFAPSFSGLEDRLNALAAEEVESAEQALLDFQRARTRFAEPRAAGASIVDSLRSDLANSPWQVTRLAKYVDAANFDAFVQLNWPFHPTGSYTSAANTPSAVTPNATPLSLRLGGAPQPDLPRVRIEYDGPARNNNSKDPFPYTNQTLFNDPSGIYMKLLWWYFGGRPYRITKAMRLVYQDPVLPGHILIGYQGPSWP
jgi:hypothetical protein